MKGYQSPAQFIRHTFPPRSDALPPVIHAVCRQPPANMFPRALCPGIQQVDLRCLSRVMRCAPSLENRAITRVSAVSAALKGIPGTAEPDT